jgi:2-polyprenyl-3-methyl-5-hydroxy-6-metoxy-1,4-benzoquinol methylase
VPVSRMEIEVAYKLLFNREPENNQAVERLLEVQSLSDLRRIFIDSDEYQQQNRLPVSVPFRDLGAVLIETDCQPEDMQKITDRIAREWRKFGDERPHWSVLTGDEYLPENIGATMDQFYASGLADVNRLLKGVERSGLPTDRFGKVLDFGCGVGRLVLALAPRSKNVTGVDISPAHIELGRERTLYAGCSNVDFVAISSIDDLEQFLDFDLITSYLVIQHNPPPVQLAIVRKLLSALAPGGLAVLQVPTYISSATRFSVEDYLANTQPPMEMNALPQKPLFAAIDETECLLLEIFDDGAISPDMGISHTFTIQKKIL